MSRDEAWWDGLLRLYAQQSEMGASAFCLSRGIKPSQLYYQQRKRQRSGVATTSMGSTAFREYVLPGEGAERQRADGIAGGGMGLYVGGVVIELAAGFADVSALRAVLSCCG